MRLKRQHACGHTHAARFLDGGFDDRLMAAMDPVKIAERENTAFREQKKVQKIPGQDRAYSSDMFGIVA